MSISHRLFQHGLCAICVGLIATSASAGLIGGNVLVSNSGARFPDVAFNSVNGTYLVIWTDYNQSPLRTVGRRVDGNGATIGAIFNISDGVSYGMVPAICYNPTNNEWLVTWDDGRGGSDHVYGQRVRGSDGVLLGGNFAIGSIVGVRSCASWSSAQNAYLVVFSDYAEVYGQRVSNTGGLLGGNFNISNDAVFSGLPVVCAGSGGTQYLVTWDYNPSGNLALIRGCRITASTGALLGSPFNITSTNVEDRSCIAYDTVNARYWVQWNQSNPGMSYDQYARFVSTSGTLIGGTIPLLASTDFEGDSQFGGDCAYLPGVNRFWTQGANVGSFLGYGGIEYDNTTGAVIGTKTTLGLGDFMIGNCAADTNLNRYLSCWEGYVGPLIYTHIQIYGTAGISQTAVSINLGNTNIEDLMTSPIGGDGDTIGATGIGGRECRRNMDPAANDFYFYFTVNDGWAFQGNKQDVWIYADYYDQGTGSITLQYDAVSNAYKDGGTVLLTNTNTWKTQKWHVTDAYFGNRENNGGDFRIYVGNVVRYLDQSTVNQNTPSTTPPGQASNPSPANGATGVSVTPTLTWTAGVNATAHNVYFGTTNPPAFIGVQAGTTYAPGTLANGTTYYWRIDEYRTSGGTTSGNVWSFTTTGGLPGLATNPSPANAATGVSVSPSLSWTAGSGATSHDVRFGTVNPPPFIQNQAGTTYNPGALIGNTTYFWRIDEKNAVGTTTGTVWSFTTTFCFSDAFAYANGNLNGNGSWTGSATSQIQIVSQTVKINGGATAFDANRTISCTGSGGIIQVNVKVQGGGTGALTMWSLWFDDPAGINLCRWYGTATTATGRIGGSASVTPAQTLTGGWDNLRVKINTSAKTAEFFFNNVSIGTLNYAAQGAANTLGRLRFERINNSGAAGHFLSFDDLVTY